MHRILKANLLVVLALAGTVGVQATLVETTGSWDGAGKNLNDYFAAWGVGQDVNTDQLAGDEYWDDKIASGSSAMLVLEVAGHAPLNSFGIFQDLGGITRTELFSGPDAAGSSQAIAAPTGAFGFYLGYQGTYFYSDPTLNGGDDQMVSYQGPGTGTTISTGVGNLVWDANSYLIAWEDLAYSAGPSGTDNDFNDMVLMLRVRQGVPDGGMTLMLLGAGLLGLASVRRKLS